MAKRFTLIEILVVMATIALLMSMLLPSLSKARDRAKEVSCMNNLHQIALSYRSYMNDSNGQMPYVVNPDLGYFRFLDDMTPVYSQARSPKIFKCPASPSRPMTYPRLTQFLQDYLCGGDFQDIELKNSQKNNGHGNSIYSFDVSNPSPSTSSTVAAKAPSSANGQQHIVYDRAYNWHVAAHSIIVSSIDDLHCYKEMKSLAPYWMLIIAANGDPKIVASTADWPNLGFWPVK